MQFSSFNVCGKMGKSLLIFYLFLFNTLAASNWVEQSLTTNPPARLSATMAFDPNSGELLLFGGLTFSDILLNDTWLWNGSVWNQLTPTLSPPARTGQAMASDLAVRKVVLFGGIGCDGNDTWVWDGSDWNQQSPIHGS